MGRTVSAEPFVLERGPVRITVAYTDVAGGERVFDVQVRAGLLHRSFKVQGIELAREMERFRDWLAELRP